MKKISIILFALLILTGCGKEETVSNVKCTANDESLANLVELELEFRNDKLYFMKQIQTIEHESEAEAIQAATQLDANSYLINGQFENIKAYTEVKNNKVLAITEHSVSKFTQKEKDFILLTADDEETLIKNFKNKGYKCEKVTK